MKIYSEFQQMSIEFLKLLGKKAERANVNKVIATELATLEFFFDGVDALMRKYEEENHVLNLMRINNKVMYKITLDEYEKEFKKKVGFKPNPNETQFKLIVIRFRKGTPLSEILGHFELSKSQLIELIDGK